MDSKGQPYPAHAPGFIPVPNQPPPQQHPTGYPHPPPQQSYAHPPPPPPYDANANMLPPGGGAGHHHPQATYVHNELSFAYLLANRRCRYCS
ncbi:hypothetical protein RP20_CCG004797 [Aedes albopictus]|nr:hypothetical protein RP20_CCG004797 [Aedes albopictus]